jgi:hypothetical protein
MCLKVWQKHGGKRALLTLYLPHCAIAGPYVSTNFFGNNPWSLSERKSSYIGNVTKYIADDGVVTLYSFGPVAFISASIYDYHA